MTAALAWAWRRRVVISAAAAAAAAACRGAGPHRARPASVVVRVWAFGREGEVLPDVLRPFTRAHPDVHVQVQQIPFTAAHEKLLTAIVGDAPPDVALIGNTWVPELAALRALAPLDSDVARSSVVVARDYFPGIWRPNVVNDTLYGVPWYVDTRLLFYRSDLLAAVGFPAPPRSWSDWRRAMERIRTASAGRTYGALLPVNEWQPLIELALANGAPLLRDGGQYGDFEEPRFRAAFRFYIALYRDSLAQPVSNTQIANRYQSFGRDEYAFAVSGPWDIGEYERRLPATLTGRWLTAPMPAPDGRSYPGAALAGGGSFAILRASPHQAAAWAVVEYLSDPARQIALARLTGDLPSRVSAWRDPALDTNRYTRAFGIQLQNLAAVPMVPEWEEIVATVADYVDAAAQGAMTPDAALHALDGDVDRMLEKRRWLLAHGTP